MLNITSFLTHHSEYQSNKVAIIDDDHLVTFQELEQSVNQVANALISHGFEKGDKVALLMPNTIYFAVVYYATLKVGGIAVPLNFHLEEEELRDQLDFVECTYLFAHEGDELIRYSNLVSRAEKSLKRLKKVILTPGRLKSGDTLQGTVRYRDFVDRQSEEFACVKTSEADTAVIVFSSGITEKPKAIELTHSSILWNTMLAKNSFGVRVDDVLLTALPLYHINGLNFNLNNGIISGVTSIILSRFDAYQVIHIMAHNRVSIYTGTPTSFWELCSLKHNEELLQLRSVIYNNLRLCVASGAKLLSDLFFNFEVQFLTTVFESYGLTETSGICTINTPPSGHPESIGKPLDGVLMKVIDPEGNELAPYELGEICIAGMLNFKGYFNDPCATENVLLDQQWIKSGDIGYKDVDGFYYILDRTNEIINKGGEKIFPSEIEEVLMEHPSVSLVSVLGVKNEIYGEEIVAFVLLNEGFNVGEGDLLDWIKKEISSYKVPKTIHLIDEFPMSNNGRVSKKKLLTIYYNE